MAETLRRKSEPVGGCDDNFAGVAIDAVARSIEEIVN